MTWLREILFKLATGVTHAKMLSHENAFNETSVTKVFGKEKLGLG